MDDVTNNEKYRVSNEYKSEDFPKKYHNFLLESVSVQESFAAECLQKIYDSGRLSGTRLLDFGCGPIVHRVASASRHFNEIFLSEWSESNRREVEKWLRADKDALDWTPMLEICARAEGCRNLEVGVADIERRIRKVVKKVVPCDGLSEDILPKGLGDFDVISSSYCLESFCPTIQVYKECVKKLVKHLKKGGTLVMATVLESTEYTTHETLFVLPLTEPIIKEALNEAGLETRDWFIWRDTGKYDTFRYAGVAIHYSIKP